jgi:hypothetical protein
MAVISVIWQLLSNPKMLTLPFLGQFLRATPNNAWHTGGYAIA